MFTTTSGRPREGAAPLASARPIRRATLVTFERSADPSSPFGSRPQRTPLPHYPRPHPTPSTPRKTADRPAFRGPPSLPDPARRKEAPPSRGSPRALRPGPDTLPCARGEPGKLRSQPDITRPYNPNLQAFDRQKSPRTQFLQAPNGDASSLLQQVSKSAFQVLLLIVSRLTILLWLLAGQPGTRVGEHHATDILAEVLTC